MHLRFAVTQKKEEHPQTRMLPIDSNNKIIRRRRSAERG